MFDEEGLDGILIGHPDVPGNKYLKPDCVLITGNRLLIIDFKNHGGKIWLPDERSFEKCIWRHDNTVVDGGTTINPFAQLKRQKEWMEGLIGTEKYGKAGIACLVCFQTDMHIMNKVPGKYQAWFSVTNRSQFVNRIRDIIDIKGKNVDIEQVASYFEAKPYKDYYSIDLKSIEAVERANAKMEEAEKREAEADEKVSKLTAQIELAEANNKSVEKLKNELKLAKNEATKAKEIAEREKAEFDEKRHEVELETQKAIRAHEEANRARLEDSKAEKELEREKIRSKTKKGVWIVVVILTLACIGVFAGFKIYEQNILAQEEAEKLAQIEEDYKNGRECIPVERVADFDGSKNVCVEFYASYINGSTYYVFIDNAKNGTFALMISKNLISEDEAKEKYLNKHLNVRGDIYLYEQSNQYEIKITSLSQISILE